MKMTYYIRETMYKCPRCRFVIRFETEYPSKLLIYTLLFIPVGLIVLIVKYIHRHNMKKTSYGEEVVQCRECGAYIAIGRDATRIIMMHEDLRKIIDPAIKQLMACGIMCEIKETQQKYDERIFIRFFRAQNVRQCYIVVMWDKILGLKILLRNNAMNYEAMGFDCNTMVSVVKNELLYK